MFFPVQCKLSVFYPKLHSWASKFQNGPSDRDLFGDTDRKYTCRKNAQRTVGFKLAPF